MNFESPYSITLEGRYGTQTVLPFFTVKGYTRECQRLLSASHVYRRVTQTTTKAVFRSANAPNQPRSGDGALALPPPTNRGGNTK